MSLEDHLFKLEQERLVMLDHVHELVCHFKLDGTFTYVNPIWTNTLRYEKWEAEKMNFTDILPYDQAFKWRKLKHRLAHGAGYSSLEFVFKTKNGDPVHTVGSLQPILDDSDEKHIVGIFQDMTLMKQAENERDRLFFFSVDMLCIMGFDGKFKRVNPAFPKTLGFSEEEFLRNPLIEFAHPDDKIRILEELSKLRNGIPRSYFETRCRRKDGSWRWLNWTAYPVPAEKVIYCVARDVTGQREMKESLEKLAYTDELTKLFNRRGLFIVADSMLKIACRKNMGILLLMADLDNMKFINDNFGHRQGDHALMAAAEILKSRFRESDVVARLGGDEFVAALLTNGTDKSETIRASLEGAVAQYNHQMKHSYFLSLSLGFCYAPPGVKISLDELIHRADLAMYRTKRGRDPQRAAG